MVEILREKSAKTPSMEAIDPQEVRVEPSESFVVKLTRGRFENIVENMGNSSV